MNRPMGRAAWRDPMKTKTLYQLTPESFKMKKLHELDEQGKSVAVVNHIVSDRVGNCWAEGRLRPGDIVLCDELSGDCFYDFYLVDFTDFTNRRGVHMRLIPYPFGAYAMNATELIGFTERDYHLLKDGEQVEVMVTLRSPEKKKTA